MPKRWNLGLAFSALLLIGAIGCAGILTGLLLAGRKADQEAVQVAPLLRQIQSLGQLHTVRYHVQDTLHHETALQPEGWLQNLPGAESLYRAVTQNAALIVAEGGVEAGIDLTQVTPDSVTQVATPEGPRVRIRLPRATLYPPDVKVRVVSQKPGLFWNDRNLIPKAMEAAKRRAAEAARQSDILAQAEANAAQVLTDLHRAAGYKNIEYYF